MTHAATSQDVEPSAAVTRLQPPPWVGTCFPPPSGATLPLVDRTRCADSV